MTFRLLPDPSQLEGDVEVHDNQQLRRPNDRRTAPIRFQFRNDLRSVHVPFEAPLRPGRSTPRMGPGSDMAPGAVAGSTRALSTRQQGTAQTVQLSVLVFGADGWGHVDLTDLRSCVLLQSVGTS